MLPPLLTKLSTHQTLIVAHRGASGHFTENTIEAFEKAVELGADMIELDVRATKDGQLVCYHDDTLNDIPINSLDYSQISSKNIPLLDEVLEKFHDKIYFVLELKQPDWAVPRACAFCARFKEEAYPLKEKLITLISKYNLFGRVVFASEDLQYLLLLKQTLKGKAFYCAVLTPAIANTWEEDMCALDGIICSIAEANSQPDWGGSPPLCAITFCNRLKGGVCHLKKTQKAFSHAGSPRLAGLPQSGCCVVGVYGVRTEADVALCRRLGIRFIGTDYPEEIRQIIGSL